MLAMRNIDGDKRKARLCDETKAGSQLLDFKLFQGTRGHSQCQALAQGICRWHPLERELENLSSICRNRERTPWDG